MLSIYNDVYESLIMIDDNYMPQGCLAESWEGNQQRKNWTLRFSSGYPFLRRHP